jgi:hypothetical protein
LSSELIPCTGVVYIVEPSPWIPTSLGLDLRVSSKHLGQHYHITFRFAEDYMCIHVNWGAGQRLDSQARRPLQNSDALAGEDLFEIDY